MKKYCFLIVTVLCVTILAGCSSSIPELSQEDTEKVTSYAAELLLQYDANYQSKLLDSEEKEKALEQLEKQKQKEEEIAKKKAEEEALKQKEQDEMNQIQEQKESSDVIIPEREYKSIDEILGLSDTLNIHYVGYELVDAYPEGNADEMVFQMKASKDKKLLVLYFDLSNNTNESIDVDILSLNARFGIRINDEKEKNSLTTLLMDDLSTYQGTLELEQVVKTVLISEVDYSSEDEISTIDVDVKYDGNKVITALK